ncbi:MAG: diguanylate cyclase [Desulfohalobium sp.]
MPLHTKELLPQTLLPVQAQDLLQYQNLLFASLKETVDFSGPRLYFPTADKKSDPLYASPRYEPEAQRLFLPLRWNSEPLALFVASGVYLEAPDAVLPYLAALAQLCVEKIALCKLTSLDRETGLYNAEAMDTLLEQEIERVLTTLRPGPESALEESCSGHSASVALLVIEPDRIDRLNTRYGPLFGDKVLTSTASTVRELCPEGAILGRDKQRLYLLWPQASQRRARQLADHLRLHLTGLILTHEVTHEEIAVFASIGLALFPQDFLGWEFQGNSREHTRVLQQKARKALKAAQAEGGQHVYAFPDLLARGCSIIKELPLQRFLLDAGRDIGASEGDHFLVWPPDLPTPSEDIAPLPTPKGEIVIVDILEGQSVAEIVNQDEPAWTLTAGDRLTLLPALQESNRDHLVQPEKEGTLLTGLPSFREFLNAWSRQRGDCSTFAIVLLGNLGSPPPSDSKQARENQRHLQETAVWVSRFLPENHLIARHSTNSLVLFLPHTGLSQALDMARQIEEQGAETQEMAMCIGIATYPCLDAGRSEIVTYASKALEHARLLTPPRIAALDSITLNISADRLFTQGDLYAALGEYQRSLTLDPANTTARNSLGICFARLGKNNQARKEFETILTQAPENHIAYYNLGCLAMKTGDPQGADSALRHCLRLCPDHVYSQLRLGQLAENEGALEKAREHYVAAAASSEGEPISHRYLARLARKEGLPDTAREHLHKALAHNPRDGFAMHLLARLYLEAAENLDVAATLARESALSQPQRPEYWELWEAILREQGQGERAAAVQTRKPAVGGAAPYGDIFNP